MGWSRTSGDCGAASFGFRCANGRGRGLRAGLAALALILLAPIGASAADMPEFLRGSYTPSVSRWEGFYFGAQAGQTWGSADLGNADNSLVGYMLANTELQSIVTNFTTLPKSTTGGASYGGFIGYNWQWDDVVLGAELNYNHMSLGMSGQDSTDNILITSSNPPPGIHACLQCDSDIRCFGSNPRYRDGARAGGLGF